MVPSGAETATRAATWTVDYPWISFEFNPLRILEGPTWAILGECSSKIEHVSGTPMRKDTADKLRTVFIAKGVHATTAIEGNTLTEEQVRQRVEHGSLNLPQSQQYLEQELDNIIDATNMVAESVIAEKEPRPFRLKPQDLKDFNRAILKSLPNLPDGVVPGQYRRYIVAVNDYRAPEAQYLDAMVEGMCEWLNESQFRADFGSKYVCAILRAILAHLYIAWIHPFGDGNGRTARVVEFDILFRAGVPIVCAHLLSDHYNRTRAQYYRALSLARKHPIYFVEYATVGLRDSLLGQIGDIRAQQTSVTWVNYVHSLFHQHDSSAQARRRREIALCLADQKDPIAPDRLTTLTPKLALMYSGKTSRTVQRDVRDLRMRQLLVVDRNGRVRANLEIIRAFLPFSSPEEPSKKS